MKLTSAEIAYVRANSLCITEKCDGCGKLLNQSFRYTITPKPEVYCSGLCRDEVFLGCRREGKKHATHGKCAYRATYSPVIRWTFPVPHSPMSRIGSASSMYPPSSQLQADLNRYLEFYNRERAHQGYRTQWHTTYQAFLDGVNQMSKSQKAIQPSKKVAA